MKLSLRRFLIVFIFGYLLLPAARAQVNITTPDTTICDGQTITLRAMNGSGIPVSASLTMDDQYSSVINIGFPFTFYGNTYTQCLISTNGFVSFDIANAGLRSEWDLNVAGGGAIPGNNFCLNSIIAHYADIYPSATQGSIDYATAGVAPNRKFIVNFCDVRMYSCTSLRTSFQIIMNEGSNIIEIHLREKPVCTSWPTTPPSGNAIEGLHNATGTIAHVVGNRNYPVQWTATRSSHRFTPTSATNYTIDSIAFAPIATAGPGAITWYNTSGTVLGTGNTYTFTPVASPTKIYARQIYCQDTTVDSVTITLGGNPNIDSVQTRHPSYCGNNDGSLVLFGLQPGTNYNIDYNKNGVPQPRIMVGASSAGTISIDNLTSGIYSNIGVSTPLCNPGNRRGPYTLVDPRIPVDFNTVSKFGCEGIDSMQFINITPPHGTIAYRWSFGDGQQSTDENPTHAYFNQAVYNVKLVADNGTCKDSISKNIDTRHPLVARFNVDYSSACLNQVLSFRDSSTTTTQNNIAPSYFWDFGDGNTATGANATHSYTATGTYTVMLVVTDFVPCSDTAYRTITVNAPPVVTFTSSASTFCEGQGAEFVADFHGDIPTSYEWTFSDQTFLRDMNPVNHAFDAAGNYTIRLVTHYEFCPDTNYMQTVTVNPFPGINIGPDTALCPGAAPIVLRNFADFSAFPGATYTWSTGATTPSIQVNDIGTYFATVDYNGCTSTDSMTIFKNCYLDIPNSFSPNNDGLNDYFLPRQLLSKGVTSYKMSIFNRWGQLVFETTALSGRGWDGRFNDAVQPQGVYIYVIDVSYTDGRQEHYTNNVTLIR